MQPLLQDLRYGLRMLARNPGFTAVAVLTLALGIGANTAIFTLINAVMLRSLPVERPEQLVLFSDDATEGEMVGDQFGHWRYFPYALFEHLRAHQQSFVDICAFRKGEESLKVRQESGHAPHLADGKLVSGNYFSVLGVRAALGRTFTPDDDREGAAAVAVISQGYWQRRFSRDPSVIGRTLYLNDTAFTIVGVTPPEFFGETWRRPPHIWLPMAVQPRIMLRESFLKRPEIHWLNFIARLKPGVSRREAGAAVNVHLRQFLTAQAGSRLSASRRREIEESRIELAPGGRGISLLRFWYSRPLRIMMAAVALVLLICCANVANLLLARAAARQKEISVRLAMGATRVRLVRQLLTESILLAGLGGVAGVLLARWGVRALVVRVAGSSSPLNTTPDTTVLLFTVGICLFTGVLFGLAPALSDVVTDLRSVMTGRRPVTTGAGVRRSGVAKALVVSQVALSLPLLMGAALLVRSLRNLEHQQPGFDRDHVLLVRIDPRVAGYKQDDLPRLYQQLLDRISAVPGVRSASLAGYSPISGVSWTSNIVIEGHAPRSGRSMDIQTNRVGPNYFEAVGTPVLLGRAISHQDTETAPKVAVVNESFARYFFPNENPLGKRFGFANPSAFEVVGVVGDAKYNSLRESPPRMAFVPVLQAGGQDRYAGHLVIRTAGPTAVAAEVRRAINEIDKTLPIVEVTTLREQVGRSLNQERTVSGLSGIFGALALLLAGVGVYGLMAYSVARRTSEIGIRMALGAQRNDISRLVTGESLRLVSVGVVLGLAASIAATRVLSTLLYGLEPTDPATMLASTAILAAVAAFAGYVPARRAAKVDPMVALRYE